MLPGPGEQTRTRAKDSNVAKLEKTTECVGCQDRHGWSTANHEVQNGKVSC